MNYGLIGTGLMGLPLAERLLAAGLPLTLYNRSRTKAEPLEAVGARVVTTPETLLQEVDCVFLMVTDAAAVEATLLSPAAQAQLSGRTVIQMGTIAPQESRDLADRIHTAGGTYLECPVLGSIPEAQSGQLILMVGSTPEQFQQWRSVLQPFGPNPQHIGAVGTAMALKLALNQLIGSLTSGFAQCKGGCGCVSEVLREDDRDSHDTPCGIKIAVSMLFITFSLTVSIIQRDRCIRL